MEKIRVEREKLARENSERHRQMSIERSLLDNAVGKMMHMTSPKQRERYLKEHGFEASLV